MPLVVMAFQGLSSGDTNRDAQPARFMAHEGLPVVMVQSFDAVSLRRIYCRFFTDQLARCWVCMPIVLPLFLSFLNPPTSKIESTLNFAS